MATGGGSTGPEKGEAYYLRFHLLIVQEGTAVLKAFFDQNVPPSELKVFLEGIRRRRNYILRRRFGEQYHLLYPQNGTPKSDDFDISLLVFLLNEYLNLKDNTPWWTEKDNNNIPETTETQDADIVRIRNTRNWMQHKNVASLEKVEFESLWNNLEKALIRLAALSNISAQDEQKKIDEVKTRTLDLVSKKMRSLRANTELFLHEYGDSSQFVETETFQKAKTRLNKKRIVILTGHPGEGKTTMAARLALSMSQPHNCLKLSQPSDWREIDLSLKLFDTVIIDDIFGFGVLDQRLVSEWKQLLPEIQTAAGQKAVRVIITLRDYIFKESKEELGLLPMFKMKNKYSILLTSSDLTSKDKTGIFEIQAKKNDKDIPSNVIQECIKVSEGSKEEQDFLFGFPECASMFVRNDELRKKGADFFRKPAIFFKSYLQDLYKGNQKGKFMALVAVWAKENKRLCKDELRKVTTASDHIKRITEEFEFRLSKEYLEMLCASLISHVGGFLVYNETTEEYAFSHNVIADMVGLVVGQEKPEETIKVCPRDFLMEYVSIHNTDMNDFKVILKERKIHCLVEKCTEMLLRKNCNKIAEERDADEFQMLRRQGQRGNNIQIINNLDFGIIKHSAFKYPKFVKAFVDHVEAQEITEKVFCVPVMTMTGYFLDYGISMKELKMYLIGYAWFSGATQIAKEVLTRRIVEMDNQDRTISLLLATHSRQKDSVQYLLDHGADVTGDVINIAVHQSPEILEILLKHSNKNVNDKGNAINGNYPLIVAAQENVSKAVEILLNFGADTAVQNTAKMTALHTAILNKCTDIINVLIEAGAPLNVTGGELRRTPLHLAADSGETKLVQILLEQASNVRDVLKIKDCQGKYPIHIAAIEGHVKIVRLLLEFEKSQENLRFSCVGSKSSHKNMSIVHVAIWKNNVELLKALIRMGIDPNMQDFLGLTPLLFAIMEDQEQCVEVLLNYVETDIRIPDNRGITPLHAAISKDLTDVAKRLLEDSDVNSTDELGRTALHVACEKVNIPIIEELLKHGGDYRMRTKTNDTVYHLLNKQKSGQTGETKNNVKTVEMMLAKLDPDFVRQLPKLKNDSGVEIEISLTPDEQVLNACVDGDVGGCDYAPDKENNDDEDDDHDKDVSVSHN